MKQRKRGKEKNESKVKPNKRNREMLVGYIGLI